MEILAIAAVAVVATWVARHWVLARRRSRRAGSVARELVPEIRSIMQSAEPKGPSEGEPELSPAFDAHRGELAALFPREILFSVETFYQCVQAYRDARHHMIEAFSGSSKLSLGDRIRAKDVRDRCLKDLFYSGSASLEYLEKRT